MASGYGMLSHLLWNEQASWGTARVTSQHAIPIISENIRYMIEQLPEASMFGRFHESPYRQGTLHLEGDIVMEVRPGAFGHILKATLGQVSTTSDTNLQTHVFEPRPTDFDDRSALPPATIEVYRNVNSAFQYHDMVVNRLQIEAANGQLLRSTATVMGAGYGRKNAATPVFPTRPPFKWDQSSVLWNGGLVQDFRSLTWTIQNNLELGYVLNNSGTPFRAKRTNFFQVEVSGVVVFAQDSYNDAFTAQSEVPLRVAFTGTTPEAIIIDVPLLRLKTFEPVVGGPGLVEAAFTGQAMYLSTSATNFRITLSNTTNTYY